MSIEAQALSLQHILAATSDHYHVTTQQILSRDRTQAVVTARQVSMYIMLTQARESLSSIAETFGKTPATVLHHVKTIKGRLENELDLRNDVADIIASSYQAVRQV